MIDVDEYCIRYIDMPSRTKGLTVEDADGFYSIYINAKISAYEQKAAIIHELTHIERNDFDRNKTLKQAERF